MTKPKPSSAATSKSPNSVACLEVADDMSAILLEELLLLLLVFVDRLDPEGEGNEDGDTRTGSGLVSLDVGPEAGRDVEVDVAAAATAPTLLLMSLFTCNVNAPTYDVPPAPSACLLFHA